MWPSVSGFFHFTCFQGLCCSSASSLFNDCIIFNCMIYHILFIHLLVDGHLGCFCILSMNYLNNASMNICIQDFVWMHILHSVGHTYI